MQRRDFLTSGLVTPFLQDVEPSALQQDRKPLKSFYLPPDPEPLVAKEGIQMRLKVRTRDTDNQFGSVEFAIAPKTIGPIPHLHEALDEIMYVHEGEMHVMVGEEVTIVKAGGYHLRPHGIVHCFWNASDKPARFTDLFFNQNFDDFFEELFHKILPEMEKQGYSRHSPEVVKRRSELNKRFGLTQFPEKAKLIIEKYGLKT
jgi:quercetin dioxygenase-like cupin family protein